MFLLGAFVNAAAARNATILPPPALKKNECSTAKKMAAECHHHVAENSLAIQSLAAACTLPFLVENRACETANFATPGDC